MKSSEEVSEFLLERIAAVYDSGSPQVAGGGTAWGVELLLQSYHEALAFIFSWETKLNRIWKQHINNEDCAVHGFAITFSKRNPSFSDRDAFFYTVSVWKSISHDFGINMDGHRYVVTDLDTS